MQLPLFEPGEVRQAGFELSDLFEAYYSCRVNKRGTRNALAFEIDFETNLVTLWRELNQGHIPQEIVDAMLGAAR